MTTAIVVARGGSTRLPNKALLPFAGTTMIGHKVDTLRKCSRIDRVVVGSDSPDILAEGEKHGAEIVRRDDYHCDESKCSANEMIRDMVSRVSGADGDVFVWAHPTNPLVTPTRYADAITKFEAGLASGTCDSLFSVTHLKRHAWSNGTPLNFDPHSKRHQVAAELPAINLQDGSIFIQTRKRFLETSYFYGSSPIQYPLDDLEAIDIDHGSDLVIARALWDWQFVEIFRAKGVGCA